MHDLTALENRLRKNQRTLYSWARQHGFDCYRLYERDIPELCYIVDRYGEHAVVYDRYDDHNHLQAPSRSDVIQSVARALNTQADLVEFKERRRMSGNSQYEKIDQTDQRMQVREGGRNYLVNLKDYLDTGLFLDHRPMRDFFQNNSAGRFLNLFCYTGSVSVAAALGGAKTTSIDMSNRYIDWARDNFTANKLEVGDHTFIRDDVIKMVKAPGSLQSSFDTIFLDPPTFSNSKKMAGSFDVQRDHDQLIDGCMQLLADNGVLYFSCNRSKFRLHERLGKKYKIDDISEESIPRDFRNRKIHVCYRVKR